MINFCIEWCVFNQPFAVWTPITNRLVNKKMTQETIDLHTINILNT